VVGVCKECDSMELTGRREREKRGRWDWSTTVSGCVLERGTSTQRMQNSRWRGRSARDGDELRPGDMVVRTYKKIAWYWYIVKYFDITA